MMQKVDAGDVLFLSDNVKEVDAAIAAGMRSIVVDRPGNAPLADADRQRLKVVESFNDLELSTSTDKSAGPN
jgi:enolase-phosphatase E1